MQKFADRISNLHPSGIRTVMAMSAKLEQQGRDVIHMEVGQADFPTPQPIIEATQKAMSAGLAGYTANVGIPELRQAVAARVSTRAGVKTGPDQVCITCGAVMGLYLAFHAILDSGSEVLIPDPGWPNYVSAVRLAGGVEIPYPLSPESGFDLDLAVIEEAITPRTKAILINFPGNPTGGTITEEKMDALLDLADRHGLYVISDEIYEDFVFSGYHVSALRPDRDHSRVMVISGVSKSYSMTGWRIGWIVAPEPFVAAFGGLVEPMISCAPTVSQMAALAALASDQTQVDVMANEFKQRAEIVYDLLSKDDLLVQRPKGAFFAMVDISRSGMNSDEFVEQFLEDKAVAVAPGKTFGESAQNQVRLSTAVDRKALVEGCNRLREFILSRV